MTYQNSLLLMVDKTLSLLAFEQSYPGLAELGAMSMTRSVVNTRMQQNRFSKKQEQELKKFIESSASTKEISDKFLFLQNTFGEKFEKSCRDKYKVYIEQQEFVFTPEIDSRIMYLHYLGVKDRFIAQNIGCKTSKKVRNRINFLTRKRINYSTRYIPPPQMSAPQVITQVVPIETQFVQFETQDVPYETQVVPIETQDVSFETQDLDENDEYPITDF